MSVAAAAALSLAATIGAQPASDVPAEIVCGAQAERGGAVCRVDVRTFVGWRVFHAQCATCHAQDALGSDFAPDLTERLRAMSERDFVRALDEGYMGPDDPLPRGANPDVARYYAELWSYLAARARGALPPGPLERLPRSTAVRPD